MKPTTDKVKKTKPTIRTKIFSALTAVIVMALALLWLCQVVLFDTVYSNVRISEIKATARHIKLFTDSNSFFVILGDTAAKNDICAEIVNTDGSVAYSAENTSTCLLHSLSVTERRELLALASEGTLFRVTHDAASDSYELESISGSLILGASNIFYIEAITHGAKTYYLILDAAVSPVGTVKKASASFLIVLSIVLIIVAVLLANYLSRLIAKPISEISRQAKGLSTGRFSPVESHSAELDELNESLVLASHDLAKVERMRTELVANLSHDLRTPLTLIGGYAELMRDLPCEVTEENLDTVIGEINRLTSLVNDMMDISMLESGQRTPHFEAFDLTRELTDTVARYRTLTEKDHYRFVLNADKTATVCADKGMILQVITNLLNNAMTYTGADRTVTVTETVTDTAVRVEIADSGEGIAPDDLPMIWERYYKVDSAHKRAAKGTGLGLSIVRQVITVHNGRYGARSTQGKGSVFWFELSLLSPTLQEKTDPIS